MLKEIFKEIDNIKPVYEYTEYEDVKFDFCDDETNIGVKLLCSNPITNEIGLFIRVIKYSQKISTYKQDPDNSDKSFYKFTEYRQGDLKYVSIFKWNGTDSDYDYFCEHNEHIDENSIKTVLYLLSKQG